jgi:hypothetical protein
MRISFHISLTSSDTLSSLKISQAITSVGEAGVDSAVKRLGICLKLVYFAKISEVKSIFVTVIHYAAYVIRCSDILPNYLTHFMFFLFLLMLLPQ